MKAVDIVEKFKEQAKNEPKRIVFPEGNDDKIISAAIAALRQGIAEPILLGEPDTIKSTASALNLQLDGINTSNPAESENLERYAQAYSSGREEVSVKIAKRLVKKNLMYGAMMVSTGDADGMVAGVSNATSMVLQAAGLAIGYADGVSAPSSIFIMIFPEIEGRDETVLVFADAAVSISPSASQLAEIAVVSGRNAKRLLGIEPKVALLSFSTKGSASHDDSNKVIEATKLAQQIAPDMAIDGELQADAALIPRVAQKKVSSSCVAGQANVLIFPDLDAGNISYKLTQYLAKAQAVGPFLQGFAKPVSDLSRGASVEDILGVTAVTVVQAQSML